jgi:isopentenyl phosphate kinase
MLQFLKLGGSLITDKDMPHTLRADVIQRIATEIARYLSEQPQDQLMIGHGSGSFGHIPAREYGTRSGVRNSQQWLGFHKVWQEARALNLAVMQTLLDKGIPVVSFPASGSVTPSSAEIVAWNLEPIRSALAHGLTPVLYGDVAFDQALGGTILSTEELFQHLALRFHPERVLIAGLEEGVWMDYPACQNRIEKITPASFPEISNQISGSNSTDVTGGMMTKVKLMVDLVQQVPRTKCQIFSGVPDASIYKALSGETLGTTITA